MAGIGGGVAQRLERLSALAGELRTVAGAEFGEQLDAHVERLRRAHFRVAVIGQVKAGKTTLVNALIHRPNLLPSDVNPWTAVVTSLHFGMPDAPRQGACFRFFDTHEWGRIAERAREIERLAGEFGTSYRADELEAQLERMRLNAQRRLGDKFEHLLGKEHRFTGKVTEELLERYVCAGDAPQTVVRNPVAGRFADITKTADVYFDRNPFAVPLVVYDTPGTNDPMLVREEITRQSLEQADVFVLVLSAHQALTNTDVGLLRLLRALRLDRVVVFVNRVDELVDPVQEAPRIVEHVRATLGEAVGMAAVPVVVGSADWAEYALTGHDGGEIDLALLDAYAAACAEPVAPDALTDDSPQRARALAASGLMALERALSDAIATGPGESLVASVSRDLANIAGVAAKTARARAAERSKRITEARGTGTELVEIAARRQAVSSLRPDLDRAGATMTATFEPLLRAAWIEIRRDLEAEVSAFADAETVRLRKAIRQRSLTDRWRADVAPLRQSLHDAFHRRFGAIRETAIESILSAAAEAEERLRREVPDLADGLRINVEDLRRFEPNLASLSTPVSVELEIPWWRGIWNAIGLGVAVDEEIGKLVRREFLPIRERLVQTAMNGFTTVCLEGAGRFAALLGAIGDTLERQDAEMAATEARLAEAIRSGTFEREIAALEASNAEDGALATRAEAVAAALGAVSTAAETAPPEVVA